MGVALIAGSVVLSQQWVFIQYYKNNNNIHYTFLLLQKNKKIK